MSPLANVAESRIQEALESGEFNDLPGKGEPLDLNAYFASPSALRAGFSVLKSADAVPPEVAAMNEVHRLRESLVQHAANSELTTLLRRELQARETEIAMAMERIKRSIRHDATT